MSDQQNVEGEQLHPGRAEKLAVERAGEVHRAKDTPEPLPCHPVAPWGGRSALGCSYPTRVSVTMPPECRVSIPDGFAPVRQPCVIDPEEVEAGRQELWLIQLPTAKVGQAGAHA